MINVGSQKPNIGGTDLQGNERFTENSNEKIFEGQSYWWFEREIAWCYKWLMLQRKPVGWEVGDCCKNRAAPEEAQPF